MTLDTLDPIRSQSFTVEGIAEHGIWIRTMGGSRLFIRQEKILDSWATLIQKRKIDLNLDMYVHLGLGRNSSYVAAILAQVTGMVIHTRPIVLEYHINQ
jgi:hypothetical protein